MDDEELDALVERLRDGDCCTETTCNCDISADAITTLRECEARLHAQLAEAQAERDAVAEARNAMGRLWGKAEGRADRAEAALAAQIEAMETVSRLLNAVDAYADTAPQSCEEALASGDVATSAEFARAFLYKHGSQT